MGTQEAVDIINTVLHMNIGQMDIADQAAFLLATGQYAEKLKPFIAKYSDKLPNKTTFLFKM